MSSTCEGSATSRSSLLYLVMSYAEQLAGREQNTSFEPSFEPQEQTETSTFVEGELSQPSMEGWLSEHSLGRDGGEALGTSGAYDDSPGYSDPLRDDTTVHADNAPAKDSSKDDKAIEDLVQKKPTTTRGANGYAAWLVEAASLKLVSLGQAAPQLADLAAGRPVRTKEFRHKITKEQEEKRKRETKGKLDNVHRVPGQEYQWDIDAKETPILETLVAVARNRINAWRGTGKPRTALLKLGDFMRADMWYTPANRPDLPSPHEPGTAIDLYFVGKDNGEAYVLQLLGDLPASGTITPFRDTDSTLHLDRRDGGYGLGIPATGDFLPAENAIDQRTDRCPAQEHAEQAAGDDHSRTLEVKGIKMFGAGVMRSTATWNGSRWQWTSWAATNESLLNHVRSAKVRDAIKNFGRSAPKKP